MDKTTSANSAAKQGRRRPHIVDLAAALVLLAIVVSLLLLGIRYVRSLLLDFSQVEMTTTTVSHPGELVQLRWEYPVPAGYDGVFTAALNEGDRVREGSQIGTIQWEDGELHPVAANHTGVISYAVDGWEETLRPELAGALDWLAVLSQMEEDKPAKTEDPANLSASRIVAKVVDNLEAPLLFLIAETLPDAEEGDAVTFTLTRDAIRNSLLRAVVQERGLLPSGQTFLLARLQTTDAQLHVNRFERIDLVEKQVTGLTLPASALVQPEDGKTYVYRCERSSLVREEVEVLYQSERIAVVEGLTIGDVVVTNPELAHDGQRVYKRQRLF